ncbi:MAG: hypothetical protein ACI9MR_002123 [Myxococcota bacterium]|jgi:hypothetical protein
MKSISCADSTALWTGVKSAGNAKRQLATLKKRGHQRLVCRDMVDLRAAVKDGAMAFRFRDSIRGRTWARPSLALVLAEAMAKFKAKYPDKTLALGDVAQPGCGQLDHGVLVKHLIGDSAAKLAAKARIVLGQPTLVEVKRARHFHNELHRFSDPEDRVQVERRILARGTDDTGALTLRVAQTRFRAASRPTAAERKTMFSDALKISRSKRVAETKTATVNAAGKRETRYVTHWVDARRRRQLIAITPKRVRGRLKPETAIELRWSQWHPKKPASYRNEVRWQHLPDRWARWTQLYEAGHISHHSGRDADISWVTKDNRGQFSVDIEGIDVAATWHWLSLLVREGDRLGVPIEKILIDRKIRRHFKKHLPKSARRTRLWREVLAISPGHDAHHHVRSAQVPQKTERRAARKFGRRRTTSAK